MRESAKTQIVTCPDLRGLWWPHQDSVDMALIKAQISIELSALFPVILHIWYIVFED